MIDIEQLEALRRERFSELPLNCGRGNDPGILDGEDWRDWSTLGTTGPQLRIEEYLDRFGVRAKSILNVGVGASGLAKRFSRQAGRIVGTTIAPSEVERASALGLRNYTTILHNKYSGANDSVPGRFDFIVDDGPTTFCCCLTHLSAMLDFYASKLADNGQMVTDRRGLGWTLDVPEANRRWSFSFNDWAAAAALIGLGAYKIDESIYVLAHSRPAGPSLSSNAAYLFRKIGRKVARLGALPLRLVRR